MSSDAQPYVESSAPTRAAAPTRVAWPALGLVALVAALAVAFAWLVHVRVVRADHPLGWDEAAHSLFALAIARDLLTGDGPALAYDIYRQVYWPPLHSVLVGAAFATFGERVAVARDVSVVAYALIPMALLAAGRVMHARDERFRGWVAGGVAGMLAVATPTFVPFASLVMLELPALLAVTLTLLAYFVAERAVDRPRRRALIAVGILLAFFLKTNYGILLMLVMAIDAVIDARFSPRRLLSRRNAYVLVPVGLVLAVWFTYPPKLTVTIRALVNTQAGGVDPWTLDGLLFYPRSLLAFAGSPAMLAVLVAGVVGAWGGRRAPTIRLLLLLAGVQFLLGEVHHTKENRHILAMVPALFLLTGATAARVVGGALGTERSRRVRRLGIGAGVALGGLLVSRMWVLAIGPLPSAWPQMPGPPGPAHNALVDAVTSAADRGERVLVVGAHDRGPAPPVVDWELAVNRRLLTIEHAGAHAAVDRNRRLVAALGRVPLPSWVAGPLRRVLERSDVPTRVRTMYAGLPESTPPAVFAASFSETLQRGQIDRVIIAMPLSGAARFPVAYFDPALANPALTVLSTHVVATAQVRLDQYRVRKDSTDPAAEPRRVTGRESSAR